MEEVLQAEPVEIMQVNSAELVNAQNRAEIDMQIATAHQYPRRISEVLDNIATLAKMDEETAASCFYVLRRQGNIIKGLSVRMAEIVASQWGNARFDKRIVANDGKTITAQCTAHDLQTNVAIRTEVKRRITDKYGKTFSEDMQVVTGNAAMAIAFRNAVLQIIPQAIIKKIVDEVDKVANGKALSLEESRANLIAWFAKIGVTEEILFDHLGVKTREEITQAMITDLRGEANAIKEGTTTAEEEFIKPFNEKKESEKAKKETSSTRNAAMEAASKAFAKSSETPKAEPKAESNKE